MPSSSPPTLNPTITRAVYTLEEQIRAQLFDRLIIASALLGLLSVIILIFNNAFDYRVQRDIELIFFYLFILLVVHRLNRKRSYYFSGILYVVVSSVLIFFVALPESATSHDLYALCVLPALVAVANLFLGLRLAVLVAIFHSVLLLSYGLILPSALAEEVLEGALIVSTCVSALSLFATYQLQKLNAADRMPIADSELRLRLITENMRDAIMMADLKGIIQYASPSAIRLFSTSATGLVGQSIEAWSKQIAAEDREKVYQQLSQQLTMTGSASEYRYASENGEYVWVETVQTPILDNEQKLVGIVYVSRVITERKRAEEQRFELWLQRERLQLFKRFVSDISHDLRTPLAVISTSTYLVQKKLGTLIEPGVQHHFTAIQSQITHLERQLDNLTMLSRFTDSQARFQFETRDLNLMVSDIALEFAVSLQEKQLQLTQELSPTPLRVLVSEAEFKQGLRQLISNALQFTGAHGIIVLRTMMQDQQAVLEVVDSGIGISSQDAAMIFEPLYRADPSRNPETGGMGLGLSVTRAIVEAHAGSIEVKSAVGQGSTFRLTVPALLEPSQFYAVADKQNQPSEETPDR